MFKLYFHFTQSIPNITDWIQVFIGVITVFIGCLAYNQWKKQKKFEIETEAYSHLMHIANDFYSVVQVNSNSDDLNPDDLKGYHILKEKDKFLAAYSAMLINYQNMIKEREEKRQDLFKVVIATLKVSKNKNLLLFYNFYYQWQFWAIVNIPDYLKYRINEMNEKKELFVQRTFSETQLNDLNEIIFKDSFKSLYDRFEELYNLVYNDIMKNTAELSKNKYSFFKKFRN